MGGRKLTLEERAVIRAYRGEGLSVRSIATKVRRSPTAVHNVCRAQDGLRRPRRRGRKPKLSARDKRRILRAARSGCYSARHLRDKFEVSVTVRRIQQLLRDDAH